MNRILLLALVLLGVIIFVWPGWDNVFINPMVNLMGYLTHTTSSFVVAILIITVVSRVLLVPLTTLQQRQTAKLQTIQPRMKAIQKKYANSKDPNARRLQQTEITALYKQAGVNPIGCLGPVIVQLPIWIALYQAILRITPSTPEGIAELGGALYSWNPANASVPFDSFLFQINLASPVSTAAIPWSYILVILVGATLFLQQRVTAAPSLDPQQQSSQRVMQWMLPVMFGFFTWFFPAGLAVYILLSNIIGVVLQLIITKKSPMVLIRGNAPSDTNGANDNTTNNAPKADFSYKPLDTEMDTEEVSDKETKNYKLTKKVTHKQKKRTRGN